MLYTIISLDDIFSGGDNAIVAEKGKTFFSTDPYDYINYTNKI